jgi:hypothetical protein
MSKNTLDAKEAKLKQQLANIEIKKQIAALKAKLKTGAKLIPLLFALVFLSDLRAQAPNCNLINQVISSATSGTQYNNTTQQKCVVWKMSYFSQGFSALSIQLESAPDVNGSPGVWTAIPAANVVEGTNPTTNTVSATISVNKYFPWVRVNVTSVTGTGSLNYNLIGNSYVNASISSSSGSSTATVSGPDAAGAASTSNPVQVGINDGTVVRRMTGDTSGRANVNIGSSVFAGIDGSLNSQMASLSGAGTSQLLPSATYLLDSSSGNWNRQKQPSITGFSTPLADGSGVIEKGGRWNQTSVPAAGSQATTTRAAGGGQQQVVDCVGFSAGSTTAPALTQLVVNLRDGATGAGTVLASWTVIISAATGQNVAPHSFCGLNIHGTTATAMTIEFSAALANLFENVWMSGYTID